jgi:hypothetical protein
MDARTRPATARRRRAVERLVATEFAHDRLSRAAFDVIADGLDLGPCAIRSTSDRRWIEATIAAPIRHVADLAVRELVAELTDLLADGPPDLIGRVLAAAPDDAGAPVAVVG